MVVSLWHHKSENTNIYLKKNNPLLFWCDARLGSMAGVSSYAFTEYLTKSPGVFHPRFESRK